MKKFAIGGIAAFIGGFAYEQGRKLGNNMDVLDYNAIGAGIGNAINKLAQGIGVREKKD